MHIQRSERAIFIAVLLLAVPTAMAGWGAKGSFEPDTLQDISGGFMTLSPDATPGPARNVYFNGFSGLSGSVMTSLNPNLATLRSSFLLTPSVPLALLGVWKDCNRDGFVGIGDNGALEYQSTLLTNVSVCPPGTPSPETPWATHNDGQWVVEFVPIGYDDITTGVDEDPLTINSTLTRVWADWGLPEVAPPLVCPIAPTPYGTFRSTGGLLRYADCYAGYRGTQALGMGDAAPDRPDRSASTLNRQNPWGDADDASMARVFNCQDGRDVVVSDPTGGTLDLISDDEGRILEMRVFGPGLSTNPSGSLAGTVNETEAGVTDCDRSNPGEVVDLNGRQGGSDGDIPYGLENGDEASSPFTPRVRTDHAFVFQESQRGGGAGVLLGPRTREHAGAGAATLAGLWMAEGDGRALGPNAFVSRSTLAPEPVLHITFYAYVERDIVETYGLNVPFGGDFAIYGANGCLSGAFECDPELWWRDGAGRDVTPRDVRLGENADEPGQPELTTQTEIGVRVGQRYNLRDVDCIDSSAQQARDADVHWGRASGTACVRPS